VYIGGTIGVVWFERLIVEPQNEHPAIPVAKGKHSFDDFGRANFLVRVKPPFDLDV
jgi:hypothetical protein